MNYKDEIEELQYICDFLNKHKFVKIDTTKIKQIDYKYTNIKIDNNIYSSTFDVEAKLGIKHRIVRGHLEDRKYFIVGKNVESFVKEYKSGKTIIKITYNKKCRKRYDIENIEVIF